MKPELLARVHQTWAEHFQLPPERITQPGTTLFINRKWAAGSPLELWPVGDHTVVEIVPALEAELRTIIAQFPVDHRLTLDNLLSVWGAVKSETMPLYALDADLFRPFAVPAPYTLLQLTQDDQPAFDAFLTHISEGDQEEGDVAINHLIAFGIFDGPRIVAASSVFVWRGFIDIGILTDPAYRGKGLGKAAVSACCEYYLPGNRIVGYRHDSENFGSRGIGLGLGFSPYATAITIMPSAK